MPITERKDGYYWGSKGPFKTKKKAQQVAQAAYASGYVKKGWRTILKKIGLDEDEASKACCETARQEFIELIEAAFETTMLVDESEWSVEEDKYASALQSAISDLMELTTSVRAGDSLLKVEVIPMSTAHMDVSKIVNKIKLEEEIK